MTVPPTTESVILQAFIDALATAQGGTVAARMGNTGNGVLANLVVISGARLGVYALTIAAGGATFGLAYPGGAPVMDSQDPPQPVVGTIGRTFGGGGLSFFLPQGTVPFVAGDALAITTLPGTAAGVNVFGPRDWPAKPDKYPMIRLSWPQEHKESWGPNAPAYDTTTTIHLEANVMSLPTAGDAGAAAALAALGVLKRQVEVAIINNGPLYRIINQIATVDTKSEVKAQGEQHIGELTMDFGVVYPQLTEDFAPTPAVPLTAIDIFADLLNVADPTGDYTPPFPYQATEAPRTVGPDGRVEAGAVLTLDS